MEEEIKIGGIVKYMQNNRQQENKDVTNFHNLILI